MQTTNLTLLAAAALAVGTPLTAAAQTEDISYDFVEFSYATTETDVADVEIDGNALDFEGSVEIRKNIHLAASIFRGEADDLPDTDELTKTFGIGAHFRPGDRWSPWGELGFIDVDVDVQNVNASDDGFYASGGVRFVPARGYEIRAGAMRYELDEGADDTIVSVAGDISLTDVTTLTLSYSEADDSEALAVGLRFYFGKNPPRGFRR